MPEPAQPVDLRLRLFLACILLGSYLLVYVGAPVSADGKAVLAVAATLVQHGRPEMNIIGASDSLLPPLARLGQVGADGALYAKKGPTPSLALVPFVMLAQMAPWLSIGAAAMLLNGLVTVATALALYTLVRWLGCRARTALALGLLFGLATLALVYVKTLFGEPLAGLLLLLALMAAYRFRRAGRRRDALFAGGALALLVGVNLIYALCLPILGLYLFGARLVPRQALAAAGAFGLPLALMAACLLVYNWARFGSPLESGYHFGAGEGFIHPLATGLYALLFSPYRGFFPYNPLLLLAVPGWLMLRRAAPRLAWAVLALIAAQALGFASWWSWHGGIVWGPRFLLPAVPLAALCLAPLVEAAWTRRALFVGIGVLGLLSAGVQLLGALYSYFPYIGYLYRYYEIDTYASLASGLADSVVFTPALSPIVGHLALARLGWPLEPAWLANGPDAVHLLAALLLIGAGSAALHPRLGTRRALWVAILCGIVSLNVVVARQQFTPARQAVRALEEALQPPGVVLAATTLFEEGLIDIANGSRVITMNAPTRPDDAEAAATWAYALRQERRLWFVTWFGPADSSNWQERALWERASFIQERAASGHRALLFDLAPGPAPSRPGGWQFGPGLRLESYGIEQAADGLYVALQWAAEAPPGTAYGWFVHLLDAEGNITAQQDRQPQGGYAPTSGWAPGAPVIDRLFFPLPRGSNVAGWRLRIGFVDPATGALLPARGPDGQPLAEAFALLPVAD